MALGLKTNIFNLSKNYRLSVSALKKNLVCQIMISGPLMTVGVIRHTDAI